MDAQLDVRLKDAQVAVVGAMLIDDRCIGDVLAAVSPDDFPAGPYKSAFVCIRRLFADGRPVDPVTVLDAMQGGERYARFLRECMDLTPTAANVLEYCRILRELSRVAQLQQLGIALSSVQSLDDADKLMAKANGLMVERSGVQILDAEALMLDFYHRMQEQRAPEYIRCGIETLDKMTYLELGDMVGIGAAPSVGKTDRLVAQLSGTPLASIKERRITDGQWDRIADASSTFSQGKFDHVPASSMTALDIVSMALSRRHQVIFVDYLQQVGSAGRQKYSSLDVVSNTSMVLHQAAQTHNLLVVALSQLSRPEKRNGKPVKPDMHSFRESGQIEQDLDVALLMYLSDPNDYKSDRICKIGKNKEGTKGEVRLTFDGTIQRFSEMRPNVYAQLQAIGRRAKRLNNHGEADDTGLQDPAHVELKELTGEDRELPF